MLKSLYVKNYRNLKDFKIKRLEQVNLITGMNNTGKSSVLEAVSIYAAKGDIEHIFQLLKRRGECYELSDKGSSAETNIKSLSSLFTNRDLKFDNSNSISIGEYETDLFGGSILLDETMSLRFVKYADERQDDGQGRTFRRKILQAEDLEAQNEDYKIGFEIKKGRNSSLFLPERERYFPYAFRHKIENLNQFQYVNTGGIDRGINGMLFDNITLTEKESFVIESLKIIEPSTERIAFVEKNSKERTAVIKLSDNPDILPLLSMGDGMNRILTIILAMVNASDGYLLIDEFENGLHYSVQKKLWKLIFKLAQKLNVQVFATTHSNDCIYGFGNTLNDPENSVTGKLIRLDNEEGIVEEVEFSVDELETAEKHNIEIR
ncbi:recombination protein F [Bacteroidales bacterium Barb4]|nr:recombination protein F [Bacteroidales bacterium Barb4]